jgi:hypothetical protein
MSSATPSGNADGGYRSVSPKHKRASRGGSKVAFRKDKVDEVCRQLFANLADLTPAERGAVISRTCGAFNVHPKGDDKADQRKTKSKAEAKDKVVPPTKEKTPRNAVIESTLLGSLLKVSSGLLKKVMKEPKVKMTEATAIFHSVLVDAKRLAKEEFDETPDTEKDQKADEIIKRFGEAVNDSDAKNIFATGSKVWNQVDDAKSIEPFIRCLRQGNANNEIAAAVWKAVAGIPFNENDHLRDSTQDEVAQFTARQQARKEARKAKKTAEISSENQTDIQPMAVELPPDGGRGRSSTEGQKSSGSPQKKLRTGSKKPSKATLRRSDRNARENPQTKEVAFAQGTNN